MYVYFPPRTQNFFPAGSPYLSGLGDYASDLAAYKTALQKYEVANKVWHNDKKKYDTAMASYLQQVKTIDALYAGAVKKYNKDKAAWDSDKASYDVAMNAWGRAFSEARAANTTKAKQIAQTFKLNLPQSFFDAGACISASDKSYWQKNCTVVKGLGIVSYGDACGMLRLPVCNFADKPTLRAPPAYPRSPVYPAKPTLRAQPTPPVAPTAPPSVPVVVTTPTPVVVTTPIPTSPSVPGPSLPNTPPEETTIPEEEPKHSNVLMGGLIVVAVLGGGYLVYRTLKKPKAQAA